MEPGSCSVELNRARLCKWPRTVALIVEKERVTEAAVDGVEIPAFQKRQRISTGSMFHP